MSTAALHDKSNGRPGRVLYVRLSAELHAALFEEAHEHGVSMTQLAIAKLRQPLEVADPQDPRWDVRWTTPEHGAARAAALARIEQFKRGNNSEGGS